MWLVLKTLFSGFFGFVGPFSDAMSKDWRDDPVYKNSLQRLIERNREFEEARNEPRS